jgi:ABC-type hemin transport system ATPase subunit
MSELILAVEDLTVSFDGFKAVDGLNFYVEKDELRVVIGPNGAGKTTLLDLICGKTKPTAGSDQVQVPRSRRDDRVPDHAARHRPQVPEPLGLRGPHGLREPRDLVSAAARPARALLFRRDDACSTRSTKWPA